MVDGLSEPPDTAKETEPLSSPAETAGIVSNCHFI
jgi:hypothetical protein